MTETFDSIGQAAGATGIPLAILRWAKKEGCSAFKGSRFYLPEFLKWYFSKQESPDGDAEKLLHARQVARDSPPRNR